MLCLFSFLLGLGFSGSSFRCLLPLFLGFRRIRCILGCFLSRFSSFSRNAGLFLFSLLALFFLLGSLFCLFGSLCCRLSLFRSFLGRLSFSFGLGRSRLFGFFLLFLAIRLCFFRRLFRLLLFSHDAPRAVGDGFPRAAQFVLAPERLRLGVLSENR